MTEEDLKKVHEFLGWCWHEELERKGWIDECKKCGTTFTHGHASIHRTNLLSPAGLVAMMEGLQIKEGVVEFEIAGSCAGYAIQVSICNNIDKGVERSDIFYGDTPNEAMIGAILKLAEAYNEKP